MAALKQKQKDLKNISGGTDVGGAPFYANDFVRLQQNAKADFINEAEYFRGKLPVIQYAGGTEHQMGLILSGMKYDNSTPGQLTIAEGYFLSGGEVCYFAGQTFTGIGVLETVYLKKGAAVYDSRVFNDGGNKEFLVEYGVDVVLGTQSSGVPVLPGSGINPTDEVIIYAVSSGLNFAEKYCTKDAALGLLGIQERQKRNQFTPIGSLVNGFTLDSDFPLSSKVLADGSTQLSGCLIKTFAGETAGIVMGTLNAAASNISSTAVDHLFNVVMQIPGFTNIETKYCVAINDNRELSIFPPSGDSFPASGTYKIHFYVTIAANESVLTDSYSFTENFLDVNA